MNRKFKRLLLTVIVLAGIMGLTGCSSTDVPTDKIITLSQENVSTYKNNASQTIQTIVQFDDATIDAYLNESTDEFVIQALESWKNAKEELGTFQEITAQGVEENKTQVTITSAVTFEKGTATVPVTIDMKQGLGVSMSFNINYSLAETMEKAALNTAMGIGIVFFMLLFLSILIAQFKHIAKLEAKFKGKKADTQKTAVVLTAAAEPDDKECIEDGELIAVIAAAIAASENTSTDSFRVRSIKRSNSNKWKRA